MIQDVSSPQPSLEGGNYKPSGNYTMPVVNSVDGLIGQANHPEAQSILGHDWLTLARNAFDASETWMQMNVRATWSRNFAHYRSEHAHDSPALLEANKHRAGYFWPKTRTLVRAIQAAAASAYFTSQDVIVLATSDSDNVQKNDAATFMQELANYRLSNTLPWYQIVLGGIADAAVLGTVCSHQSWDYVEKEVVTGYEIDAVTGEIYELYDTNIVQDVPKVRLVPAENIRISPASDSIDPANSSPYFIELIPMFLGDVLDRMAIGDNTKNGEPGWKSVPANVLLGMGSRNNIDTTAKARAGQNRLEPKSNMTETESAFKTVWIHRNIIRKNGEDWLFYTVGTSVLLTEPVLLTQIIPWAKGKRDYVVGKMEVETDRVHPSGPVDLISGLQKATNELKNQRYDNVRQVLNRRYLYRAGSQVDVRALSRNVPGGLIGISAPGSLESHVQPLSTPDVTSSSYQEEDRLLLAMDDLSGSTTGSTVNSNRKLSETATGMNLMAEAGNQVREMELRTFSESWVKPVLTQIVQLIAAYETDEVALTVSAAKAGLRRILPEYFDKNFIVSVNVGMGATSPTQRMQKIIGAIAAVAQVVPEAQLAMNPAEIAKEIFGAAGFDNGLRFFDFNKLEQAKAQPQPPDPATQLAQAQLELKQQVETVKQQLEIERLRQSNLKLQSDIQAQQAKTDQVIARTAVDNVTAVYEAAQAAGVIAQNPGISPVTDEILKSSGFKDHNQAPVVSEVEGGTAPLEALPGNTHPNRPKSAAAGIRRGIYTPRIR